MSNRLKTMCIVKKFNNTNIKLTLLESTKGVFIGAATPIPHC